ncbi:MAG: hypothetical protein ACFFCS_07550 [Candidatus Hodarchaeota archaeon]
MDNPTSLQCSRCLLNFEPLEILDNSIASWEICINTPKKFVPEFLPTNLAWILFECPDCEERTKFAIGNGIMAEFEIFGGFPMLGHWPDFKLTKSIDVEGLKVYYREGSDFLDFDLNGKKFGICLYVPEDWDEPYSYYEGS